MLESKIVKAMREGGPALTTNISMSVNTLGIEMAGRLGFDGVWIDLEHRNFTDRELDVVLLACRAGRLDGLVRIRKGGYTNFLRPLEFGANAVMVPHVKSGEEAKAVVDNCKFTPIGRRGFDGVGPDADFAFADPVEYMKWANDQTALVVQIEDAEALPNLDEIAATDGVDVLFIGPADLSISMGIPFQWDNPRIAEAREAVAAAATKHGKFWGTVAGSAEQALPLVEQGARLINIGADLIMLKNGLTQIMDEFTSVFGDRRQ